jgi:hypothetical protein
MTNTIDIRSLVAVIDDLGLLGQITAFSEMADELARRDEQYAILADAITELWLAMVVKNVREVRRAACKVVDELDRLTGAAA